MAITRTKLSHFKREFEVTGNFTGPIGSTAGTIKGFREGNLVTLSFPRIAATATGTNTNEISFSGLIPSEFIPKNASVPLSGDSTQLFTSQNITLISGSSTPNIPGRVEIDNTGALRVMRADGNFATSFGNGFRPFSVTYEVDSDF